MDKNIFSNMLYFQRKKSSLTKTAIKRKAGVGQYFLKKLFTITGLKYSDNTSKLLVNQKFAVCNSYIRATTAVISNLLDVYQSNYYLELIELRKQLSDFLKMEEFYKGMRYKFGLPVSGQRTHTNARTIRKLKQYQ